MLKLPSDEVVEADSNKTYTQPTIEGKQNDCEYKINRSLIKNSINKFTFDIEMFLTCSNEKGEAKKSKSQIKRICTRTK
ncbi:hypothetical protein J3U42_07455 [Gilliamella sp. B2923]|uniref:hypothetical protein n=1 Tax=unclassified Gilliamella TaxID=2685620 RepID=UPI00226AFCB7|nr:MULTISPECIES: hypothetical protein [unclassified Gilliamella]MCX8618223.1 hypothetical protein [Gilliamella sp. B2923]MCX8639884.1 hypothetical protein [Gilliamella sp. B3172]